MMQPNKIWLFGFIMLLGLILRFHATSPYKFYPDSYQPLVVAENITTYGSVIAPLGNNGLLYPDFFSWTRPMYAFLINIGEIFTTPENAAQVISFLLSFGAIPLAYLFIKNVWKSKVSGLIGAALLTISYNHTVWSGFILSESIGVFFMILTLYLATRDIDDEKTDVHWPDLITGFSFACAVLTRYEYILIAIPLLYIYFVQNNKPFFRITTIAGSAVLVFALIYFFLSPFVINSSLTADQFSLFTRTSDLSHFSGLIGFAVTDFILLLSALAGVYLSWKEKRSRQFIFFTLISCILLGYMYFRTNPEIQRYMTHLIPFLLIPASLALTSLIYWLKVKTWKKYAYTTVAVLIVIQTTLSYRGLHHVNNNLWFTSGYEELAASRVQNSLQNIDYLIVSYPEPYYLKSRIPTQSIADAPPFIHFNSNVSENARIAIIEDESLREVFPNFTNFLTTLDKYKAEDLELHAPWRSALKVKEATKPISIYKITLKELTQLITKYKYEINNTSPLL
jgi:hypothetical protein